jgi:hypothetical protein
VKEAVENSVTWTSFSFISATGEKLQRIQGVLSMNVLCTSGVPLFLGQKLENRTCCKREYIYLFVVYLLILSVTDCRSIASNDWLVVNN